LGVGRNAFFRQKKEKAAQEESSRLVKEEERKRGTSELEEWKGISGAPRPCRKKGRKKRGNHLLLKSARGQSKEPSRGTEGEDKGIPAIIQEEGGEDLDFFLGKRKEARCLNEGCRPKGTHLRGKNASRGPPPLKDLREGKRIPQKKGVLQNRSPRYLPPSAIEGGEASLTRGKRRGITIKRSPRRKGGTAPRRIAKGMLRKSPVTKRNGPTRPERKKGFLPGEESPPAPRNCGRGVYSGKKNLSRAGEYARVKRRRRIGELKKTV